MRIAFLSWRDLGHPEGGGAERYAQTVCAGLAARGHDVTFFCAAHGDAPAREVLDGYTVIRAGGRMTVYPAALRAMQRERRAGGDFDVVIDTQNGLPFWSPLATKAPVVSLVHHVHREQWPVVFGPVMARIGWSLESRVSPVIYRRSRYVTVSGRTREELVELGVASDSISIIHNGTDTPMALGIDRAEAPTLVVLGRLVPHKRVEHAIDVLVALRQRHAGLTLRIVGDGWWKEQVLQHAHERGVADAVHVLGYVDELTKHRELARAWVALAPSAKEGWGLCVVEAGSHCVPTVAYHDAGGLTESVLDGHTGILVNSLEEMVEQTSTLLTDHDVRARMGLAAREHASGFTWDAAVESWERLLELTVAGQMGAFDDAYEGAADQAIRPDDELASA